MFKFQTPKLAIVLLFMVAASSATQDDQSLDEKSLDDDDSNRMLLVSSRSKTLGPHGAPYALDDDQLPSSKSANFLIRLTAANRQPLETPDVIDSKNAISDDSNNQINLRRLLEGLSNASLSSEDLKRLASNIRQVNLSISSSPEFNDQTSRVELNLQDLLAEAAGPDDATSQHLIKSNHMTGEQKQLARTKVAQSAVRQQQAKSSQLLVTAPPLKMSPEVIAENYTCRRVAEEANLFALRLLNQLNIEQLGSKNIIQNPFAVYQSLALMLTGAVGDTAKQMDKMLLNGQSAYENKRLTHDQDRTRLLASFGQVLHQMDLESRQLLEAANSTQKSTLTDEDAPVFIVANNLLMASRVFELSSEFKSAMSAHYDNTQVTEIETGSSESIQLINEWIRAKTNGIVPAIWNKRNTFDEYNVMTMLTTSWLQHEWHNYFTKVSSSLKADIRLRGQSTPGGMISGRSLASWRSQPAETLLEFVDDQRQSHFVDYIKSEATSDIQHYQATLGGVKVDMVVAPLKNNNHKYVALTPTMPSPNETETFARAAGYKATDSSVLSKLISALAENPRKATRSIWKVVSPDLITKQTYLDRAPADQKEALSNGALFNPMLVQLSIPISRCDADYSLTAALNHIGFVNPFDANQANFIGINGHPFNYYALHLSDYRYATTMNINERGFNFDRTIKSLESHRIISSDDENPQRKMDRIRKKHQESQEQADLDSSSIPVDRVTLNRPFVYLICDVKTKLILYTGVMRNPTQSS